MTFYQATNRYPPILCRLLARRKNGPPLTDKEIADRSGLTVFEVKTLSTLTRWDDVPVGTMWKFLVGCGTDFCKWADMKRIDAYRRSRPTWKYLRRSGRWLDYYEPLLKAYAASLTKPL